MSNANFHPQWSTNDIWNDVFMEECLTDELDAIKTSVASKANASDMTQLQSLVGNTSVASQISSVVSSKADANHTHSGYAASVHEHDGYITTNTPLDQVVVSMSVAQVDGTDVLNNFGKTCRYYPSLGIVFMRMYGVTTQSMTAETSYTLASIDSNKPVSNHALSIKCSSKAFSAIVSSAGNINVTPHENVSAGQSVYITGFWFV